MDTFAGIPEEYSYRDESKIVLLPVPYDGTSTYGKGADLGPGALLEAADNMELYDIETNSEVFRQGIYLAPPLVTSDEPDKMVFEVEQKVREFINEDKFVTTIGGEHSISIGTIRAHKKRYTDLTILQIDAHSDLRPEYNGSEFNHACALHEASKTCNLVQVGIRSMDKVELPFMKKENVFFSYDIRKNPKWLEEVLEKINTKYVYITIDLDAFDPSIMPSTGTPEPGGLMWHETLDLLKKVFRKVEVVGFDIVELAPIDGLTAPNFLAAKLYYKLLSYKFHLNGSN